MVDKQKDRHCSRWPFAIIAVLTMVIGFFMFAAGYILGMSSMLIFFILFSVVLWVAPPKFLISPLSIIYGYYFLWFLVAPTFAEIYTNDDFSSASYYLAYQMIFATYFVAVLGAIKGEKSCVNSLITESIDKYYSTRIFFLLTVFLYLFSSVLLLMIVISSGGVGVWIKDPGDAFLNRQGSGIYVVLSHFTTFCLASLIGYRSYTSGKKFPLLIFFSWLFLTSPVHGSKGLVALILILSMTPWLINMKILTSAAIKLIAVLFGIFFFGLYLRNTSWMTFQDAVPYALNYFTALRNLILLLSDFDPDFLTTFFLPFNKFLQPVGWSDLSIYFDMNHMLTDKYFPTAWAIRATEQWPVEADLYLNFYFFFGLPLIFIYTYLIGRFYGKARMGENCGLWIVAMLLMGSIVSHFRGSLINHLDFYLYPMFIVIYLLFRRLSFADRPL